MIKKFLSIALITCTLASFGCAPALAADNATTAAATIDGVEITSVTVEDETYLFLPASADISHISLHFTGDNRPVTLQGSKGSTPADAVFDLTTITARDDESRYTLQSITADGSATPLYIMEGSKLPTIYLSSDDPAEGRAFVDSAKANATTADMKLISADGKVIYDGALTQLKARGNSSFTYYPKKAYQIKLDTKTDLLGIGEKVKTYVLLANYADSAMMRDKLFKDLAGNLGMAYTPSCDWVNLYYDGEYRGVYLLSEKNSVGSTGIDITDMEDAYSDLNADYGDEVTTAEGTNRYGQKYTYTTGLTEPADITGGYLIELNHQKFDEINGFYTAKGKGVNLRSPEYGGQQALEYISEYYQEFEDAVYAQDKNGNYTGYNTTTGKYYYEYCDLDSLVQTYLIHQLSLNIDAYVSSFYFYKDADGLMYAGPVWDMDFTCGNGWSEQIHTSRTFIKLRYLAEALCKIPSFQSAVEAYFTDTFAPMTELLLAPGGAFESYQSTLTNNAAMNYKLWPFVMIGDPADKRHLRADGTTYYTVTDDLNIWLTLRLEKLKESFDPAITDSRTTTIPGGGQAITETRKDGSTKQTVLAADGSTTITVSHPSTVKSTTGTVSTTHSYITALSAGGDITRSHTARTHIALNKATVTSAQNIGQTISLPIGELMTIPDGLDSIITIDTGSSSPLGIEVPLANITPGTVAIMLNSDGTATPIRDTRLTADGIQFTVDDDASIRIADNAIPFTDIKESAWQHDAVAFTSARGILRGTSADTFGSDEATTRAMFLTILARIAGQDTTPQHGEDWQQPALSWAVANNVSDGSAPTAAITREELATMLYRYMSEPTTDYDLNSFTDSSSISDWAMPAMRWAVETGILRGEGNGTLNPTATATRAEVAQVIMNFMTIR